MMRFALYALNPRDRPKLLVELPTAVTPCTTCVGSIQRKVTKPHRWIQFSGDCNCFPPKESLTDFCTGTGYPSNISQTHWNAIFEQRDQLIREFRWRPELRRSVDAQLEQMRATRNCSVIVAVHVRRTDYERYLVRRYGQAKLADSSYFSRAMDHFR